MAFTESLTVRILGDSSGLRRELESVVEEIRALRGELDQVTNIGDQIGEGFGRANGAVRPLEQISQTLSRITAQVQSFSQTPLTLDVQPALASLQQLSLTISTIAAQLQALAAIPVGIGEAPAGGDGPIRQFGGGGLVTGPIGNDVVPALLTAGEFVLNRQAAQTLGTSFLEALNAQPAARRTVASVRESGTRVQHTNNHFGGITINVAQPSGVNEIIRDLRLQGVMLRNRRG